MLVFLDEQPGVLEGMEQVYTLTDNQLMGRIVRWNR